MQSTFSWTEASAPFLQLSMLIFSRGGSPSVVRVFVGASWSSPSSCHRGAPQVYIEQDRLHRLSRDLPAGLVLPSSSVTRQVNILLAATVSAWYSLRASVSIETSPPRHASLAQKCTVALDSALMRRALDIFELQATRRLLSLLLVLAEPSAPHRRRGHQRTVN